jgi:hypothetical protein
MSSALFASRRRIEINDCSNALEICSRFLKTTGQLTHRRVTWLAYDPMKSIELYVKSPVCKFRWRCG